VNAQSWTRYKGTRERLSIVLFPLTLGGFFFGVLAFLGLGFGTGFNGLAALGVGLLSGVIFGLVIAVTSWLVHRFVPDHTVLILASGLAAGALSGVLISGVVTANPPPGAWVQLPAPPEPTSMLVDAARLNYSGQEFYVQAESEKLYGYACLNWLVCSWRTVPEIPVDVVSSGPRAGCLVDTGGADAAAPEFVQTRGFHFCLPGSDVYFETGLQADGTLYLWEYAYSTLDPRQIVLFYAVVGGLLGAGSLYLLVRNRRLPVDELEAADASYQS
jgi:hypothetical protein